MAGTCVCTCVCVSQQLFLLQVFSALTLLGPQPPQSFYTTACQGQCHFTHHPQQKNSSSSAAAHLHGFDIDPCTGGAVVRYGAWLPGHQRQRRLRYPHQQWHLPHHRQLHWQWQLWDGGAPQPDEHHRLWVL